MKTKLLPLLSALMIVFCTTCENPWMQELVDPLFLKKLAGWMPVPDSSFGANATDSILCITYGNGRFVAGGYGGKMATSNDGINWTQVTNHPFTNTDTINFIAYGGGKFVAGGWDNSSLLVTGKLAYSSNGIDWTQVTNHPFTDYIFCIAYGGGKFVAGGGDNALGGNNGKLAYSSNGIDWTLIPITTFTNAYGIYSIAYGNGRFVAGGDGDDGSKIFYSDNGINWNVITDPALGGVARITYGNDLFVCGFSGTSNGGKIAYSKTGSSRWTFIPAGRGAGTTTFDPVNPNKFNTNCIVYANGAFVAASNDDGGNINTMAYSTRKGNEWTAVKDTGFDIGTGINCIAYGNGRFVAGGSVGDGGGGVVGKMAYCDF